MVTTLAPEVTENEDESPLVVAKRATQTHAEPTASATALPKIPKKKPWR